jgi:hypothetical protein
LIIGVGFPNRRPGLPDPEIIEANRSGVMIMEPTRTSRKRLWVIAAVAAVVIVLLILAIVFGGGGNGSGGDGGGY